MEISINDIILLLSTPSMKIFIGVGIVICAMIAFNPWEQNKKKSVKDWILRFWGIIMSISIGVVFILTLFIYPFYVLGIIAMFSGIYMFYYSRKKLKEFESANINQK